MFWQNKYCIRFVIGTIVQIVFMTLIGFRFGRSWYFQSIQIFYKGIKMQLLRKPHTPFIKYSRYKLQTKTTMRDAAAASLQIKVVIGYWIRYKWSFEYRDETIVELVAVCGPSVRRALKMQALWRARLHATRALALYLRKYVRSAKSNENVYGKCRSQEELQYMKLHLGILWIFLVTRILEETFYYLAGRLYLEFSDIASLINIY